MKTVFVVNSIKQHQGQLSLGEKQAILKLGNEGRSIRAIAQSLGVANMTILECSEKRHHWFSNNQTSNMSTKDNYRSRWQKEIVRAVTKNLKTTISNITNNPQMAGVKISQCTFLKKILRAGI